MKKRPNLVISYTTAFAFVLASCAIEVEPTDLTPIKVETDRTVIEQTLGKPHQVVTAHGFTVAAYTYDRGQEPTPGFGLPSPEGLEGYGAAETYMVFLLIAAVVAPFSYASRSAELKAKQRGHLALLFDAQPKLLFAGSLKGPDFAVAELTAVADQYAASQLGNIDALLSLSDIAFLPQQRAAFLEMAASKGDPKAAHLIGNAYRRGAGVKQDTAQAFDWWRQAADHDYVPAYYQLGTSYRFGSGVKRDMGEAKSWLTKAADTGDEMARRSLSEISEFEKRFAALISRSDEFDVAQLIEAANSYRFGISVPKDVDLAIRLYERAAANRDDYAAYALGTIYKDGEAGAVDLDLAYLWYSVAENLASDDVEEIRSRKDEISQLLTAGQISEAERGFREWLETHPH